MPQIKADWRDDDEPPAVGLNLAWQIDRALNPVMWEYAE